MNNLQFLIAKNGWTQRQLAEFLGKDKPFVSRLCRGWFAKVPEHIEVELRRIFGSEWTFKRLMEEKE